MNGAIGYRKSARLSLKLNKNPPDANKYLSLNINGSTKQTHNGIPPASRYVNATSTTLTNNRLTDKELMTICAKEKALSLVPIAIGGKDSPDFYHHYGEALPPSLLP